ncbi:hypothetical protein [Solwaraspora sp. WMMD792]|uniref:hypothetical protein n=1 Tax=Solwaraspora sp. WMMD792 TaxID=3016099 RepID=UPI0024162302|nr:hypothetical protein [Solwaraspora sp. WMMD792]MDG4775165.1 hypothetical protein [Solwaraspora sp. WMMD792]
MFRSTAGPARPAAGPSGRPAIDADVADARALPETDDGYDATLLLGPLYHLVDRDDRVTALAEAAADAPDADVVLDHALGIARVYGREPALLAASAHLLASGVVPGAEGGTRAG